MDVFIPLNRSMVEILLNRRPPCLNSNAVRAASEPDADSADATQEYSPYVPTFQSARPEDPNAQPTFTNENAWQPDYADDDADIPAPTAEEVFADEALEDPDLYLTEEEQAELRQNHWRLLSGFGDFISIIAGCAVILVLITMLVSLLNWLHSDILQSISLFQTMI